MDIINYVTVIEKIKSIFNKVSPIDEASIEKDIEYEEQNEFFKLSKNVFYKYFYKCFYPTLSSKYSQ